MLKKKCCPNFDGLGLKGLSRACFDYTSYALPLEKFQILKYGELQKCSTCNTIWFIDKNDNYSDLIKTNWLDHIFEWNEKDLSIKPEFIEILLEIGNTPAPLYGHVLKEHICVPCKCTLINGKIIDYCIINIQKRPPLYQKNYGNITFIDQVIKIERSEYCLPLDVRIETTKKGYYEEVDEYDPTIIEDINENRYYIDYDTSFFYEEEIKGADMRLRSYSSNNILSNPKFQKNKIIETQIIADWSIGLENIFNK